MKEAGDKWGKLTEEEKKPFFDESRKMKEKYENY